MDRVGTHYRKRWPKRPPGTLWRTSTLTWLWSIQPWCGAPWCNPPSTLVTRRSATSLQVRFGFHNGYHWTPISEANCRDQKIVARTWTWTWTCRVWGLGWSRCANTSCRRLCCEELWPGNEADGSVVRLHQGLRRRTRTLLWAPWTWRTFPWLTFSLMKCLKLKGVTFWLSAWCIRRFWPSS